ncbi:MAG: hypothetical protein WDO73_21005 [Ignavibacteriota bacterium]
MPERVVRSLGAISGGLLREIGAVVVPASLRRTTLYRTMVEVTLRFLIEEVGHGGRRLSQRRDAWPRIS